MNYHNAKKRDHVLDLENGITTPFSADYLFKLLNDYPVLKYEFINDTTTLDRDRLLYYLDKINYEWQSRQETTNNTEL